MRLVTSMCFPKKKNMAETYGKLDHALANHFVSPWVSIPIPTVPKCSDRSTLVEYSDITAGTLVTKEAGCDVPVGCSSNSIHTSCWVKASCIGVEIWGPKVERFYPTANHSCATDCLGTVGYMNGKQQQISHIIENDNKSNQSFMLRAYKANRKTKISIRTFI